MSRNTIALAHDVIDALERRDLGGLLELTDPEVEWRSAFAVSKGDDGVYRGHDGIRTYVKDINDAWEIVRLDVDHELAVGDIVLLIGRIRYRGKGSGIDGTTESGLLLKFSDGKVSRFRPFLDPKRALETLGLAE
jgi:ketosteroid isomerase-like protein